jgi:hypothetical protein
MDYNPFIDDQIIEIITKYVEPDKRGEAMVALKKLKDNTVKTVMNTVNNFTTSLNAEVEQKFR